MTTLRKIERVTVLAFILVVMIYLARTSVPCKTFGGAFFSLDVSASSSPIRTSNITIDSDDLDNFIQEQMGVAHIPGLSACIIKDNQVVWSKGYGWAIIEEEVPVSPDTMFILASISKTVTATALMQLYEDGLFDLDDDINDYLSFEVRNPHHRREPITFRMLLTHVSSIRDNWKVYNSLYVFGDDSEIALYDFLNGYLTPGGEYYSRIHNFYQFEPGASWHYSNVGFALVGYLVESITGVPFDLYCEYNVFTPLGMEETSWRLKELNVSHIAMPYSYSPRNGTYTPIGHYGFPTYPDGSLRTSVSQLARFLICFINYGELEGTRIMSESTVKQMRTIQYPLIAPWQGLAWFYRLGNGQILLGHDGGDYGAATLMFFRPKDGVGVILLANGSPTGPRSTSAFMNIFYRLFQEADKFNLS